MGETAHTFMYFGDLAESQSNRPLGFPMMKRVPFS